MEYAKRGQARASIIAMAMGVGLTATVATAPARAATVEECQAAWEEAPATEFCTTATYIAGEGNRCGIGVTCEAMGRIITGVDDAGELVHSAAQSLGTVTLETTGYRGRSVPLWLLSGWNVCVTSYNGEYEVRLGLKPCETGYVSAEDAMTYGVPTHADWERRDEEAYHGIVNNDPPGVLPVYGRDSDTQTCVDRWISSDASGWCRPSTVATQDDGAGGQSHCEISANCSVTARVYDPGFTRVIARGVRWESELRGLLPGEPAEAVWSQDEVGNVELCLEETGMDNDVPIFTMHARTGCEAGETSVMDATSRGIAGQR